MKTFSVNKNSWHYRLNVRMAKTNDRLDRDNLAEIYACSKDNLCSYWQMTLWSMFKVGVTIAFAVTAIFGVLYLFYLFGYALIFHTTELLVGTGSVLGLITIIIGMAAVNNWFDNRKKRKLDLILYHGETETSLAKAKYSSWKGGICVPVEFK
jgi:hypothetical protein